MRKTSILIVNDDLNSCKLFKTYCTMASYNACCVVSAEQALEQIAIVHPDLILLDMKLPGMDGIAFLRTLKADSAMHDIHVLVTTVYNEHYSQKQVLAAGADGFLIVPTEREQLMDLVTKTLLKTVQKH